MRHFFPSFAITLLLLVVASPFPANAQTERQVQPHYIHQYSADHLLTERSSWNLMVGSERNSGARVYIPQLQARANFSPGSKAEYSLDLSARLFSFPDLEALGDDFTLRTVEVATDYNFYFGHLPFLVIGAGTGLSNQLRYLSIDDGERDINYAMGLNLNILLEVDTGRIFPHGRFTHTGYFSDGVPSHRFLMVGVGVRFVN